MHCEGRSRRMRLFPLVRLSMMQTQAQWTGLVGLTTVDDEAI